MPRLHHRGPYTLKSCTRSQPNVQNIRADRRFDSLVKKQEVEHQHIISCHNKEMQTLRDTLLSASQKYESLMGKCDQDLKEYKTYSACQMGTLKVKVESQESLMAEHRKIIEDVQKQLQDFHVIYSSKAETEKLKKDVSSLVKDVGNNHLICLQDLQRELKSLLNLLKDDVIKNKFETETKFASLIEQIEENFHVTKLDKEGVLKEVRIYEKTIFIIEKKIENIYTLIERINKRGEACHKPE